MAQGGRAAGFGAGMFPLMLTVPYRDDKGRGGGTIIPLRDFSYKREPFGAFRVWDRRGAWGVGVRVFVCAYALWHSYFEG